MHHDSAPLGSARLGSAQLGMAWHGLAWRLGRRATSPRPENSRYELDHKSGRVSPRRDSREGISSGGALVSVTLVSTPGVQLTYERRDSAMTYGVVHTRDALHTRDTRRWLIVGTIISGPLGDTRDDGLVRGRPQRLYGLPPPPPPRPLHLALARINYGIS